MSRTIELRHLRYFTTVAAARGFGRAATALHLAQPALSRQIRDLEAAIGVPLLERLPKGVELTTAGSAFLTGAAGVLAAAEAAVEGARHAGTGHAGRCRLGVGVAQLWFEPSASVLRQLPGALPDVDLGVEHLDGPDRIDRIVAGDLDVGLAGGGVEHPDVIAEVWAVQTLDHALLSREHRLAGRERLTPDDLADEPLAFLSPQLLPGLVELLQRELVRAGIRSPREFVYTSTQSIIMMITAGRGWGMASADVVDRPPDGTVVVPVQGLDFPLRVDLVRRRAESRPVVLRVIDAMRALRDGRPVPTPPRAVPRVHGLPPGLELRHLRYFAAVADEGSFGRAAERLGVTQPSLSRQVTDLEDMVGTPLLARHARGATETDAGLALRDGISAVMRALDSAVGATRDARRGMAGRCVIGGVPTAVASRAIGTVLRACNQRWPGIEIVLEDYPTPRQPDALREGLIDVGVCHAFTVHAESDDIGHERLVEDPLECAMLGSDHPLAGRDRLAPSDLAGVPFLFLPRDFHPAFYDRVYAALERLGLRPRVNGSYESLLVTRTMVAEGQGWTVCGRSLRSAPPAGTVAVPIDGFSLPWGVDLLWRRNENNQVVSRVLAEFRRLQEAPAVPVVPAAPSAPERRPSRPRATRRPRR